MEKIDIEAFELDKGIYYIELQNNGVYEVDGIRTNIEWNNNKVVVDLDKSPEIFKISYQQKVQHYISSDNEILLPEEYNDKIQELRKNVDSEGDFSNLDEEYEYKKFIQKYKPVYQNTEIRTPVIYNIKHNIYNLPKYITPLRKLNGDLKSTIYVYNAREHIRELTRQALLDIGYIESDRESTKLGEFWLNKDGIRFSKIDNSSFLTITIHELRQYEENGTNKDTYEKIFDLYNRNIDNIKNIVTNWHLSKKKLKDKSYSDVIDSLRNIEKEIAKIETKNRTSSFKTSSIISIRKLIEDFQLEAKGELDGL